MRADVNTSSKKLKKAMEGGCGPSPLCEPCKFTQKRVPKSWPVGLPGAPYPCNDRLIGTEVTLRGDTLPSRVTGCANPIGPSLLQLGRVSDRRKCEGALLVRTPLGVVIPVTRSVVRERKRLAKPSRATCSCGGLPYPHRVASSPLCTQSPVNLEELGALSRDAYEGGERDERRFVAAVKKAGGRKASVATVDDAARVLATLQQRQVDLYRESDTKRMAPKSDYKKRVSGARAIARSMGWKI